MRNFVRKHAAISLAIAAGVLMIAGAGSASASDWGSPALRTFQDQTVYVPTSHGADLSIAVGGSGSMTDRFECLKAQNQGNISNIKAFCPRNVWLPNQ